MFVGNLEPTSQASQALMVWKALESYGCDPVKIFARAGLEAEKLTDPAARYTDVALAELMDIAVAETGDPAFGLRVAEFWHPSTLHALGYAWMASASLRDAFSRAIRFFRMVTDNEQVETEESGDEFRLRIIIPPHAHRSADAGYDAFMAVVVVMCRTSLGEDFRPLRIIMQRPEPDCPVRFTEFFGAPVEFSAPENIVVIKRSDLDKPLPTANSDLARASDQIITEYLARLDRSNVGAQVKAKLLDFLPSGEAGQEAVAASLNLSLRSLQRKLHNEGVTFKDLLDDTRRELAGRYIKESGMSAKEVAYLLGFSEPSNFTRAFKRWTGVSPTEYREAP